MRTAPSSEVRIFRDRQEAGRELAELFAGDRPAGELLVLALPRGGVPVARELSSALRAPLDVFIVRKLGVPYYPELAVGAIAAGGVVVYNEDTIAALGLDHDKLDAVREREAAELERRERLYRSGRPPPNLEGKTVILVDDGVATGATMRAAVKAAKQLRPSSVIAAAPTASREAIALLKESADDVAILYAPEPYAAVGQWYEAFPQLSDQDVVELLTEAEKNDARDR